MWKKGEKKKGEDEGRMEDGPLQKHDSWTKILVYMKKGEKRKGEMLSY